MTGEFDVREAAERLPSPLEQAVPDDDPLGPSSVDFDADGLDDDSAELLSVAAGED